MSEARQLAAGKVPLRAAAAGNVASPALARAVADVVDRVTECAAADTAAWRSETGLDKTHWVDALCAATHERPVRLACARALEITMTGRGNRLVVPRNASGFPRLTKRGTIVKSHRGRPPHGLRAGDRVYGRASRTGQQALGALTAARYDGRCTVATRSGPRVNITAKQLVSCHSSNVG